MDGNVYSMVSGNPSYLFRLLAISIEKSMGGSSGIFTAVFFKTMAESVRRASELSWRAAFADATSAVMEVGGAQVGDRTLIDALKPASDMLSEGKPLREAVQAAYNGFESTKTMSTAKLGRSSKVRSDALLNHGDPGAYAIYIILNAMADVMHD